MLLGFIFLLCFLLCDVYFIFTNLAKFYYKTKIVSQYMKPFVQDVDFFYKHVLSMNNLSCNKCILEVSGQETTLNGSTVSKYKYQMSY